MLCPGPVLSFQTPSCPLQGHPSVAQYLFAAQTLLEIAWNPIEGTSEAPSLP